jgi:hypothetical protein
MCRNQYRRMVPVTQPTTPPQVFPMASSLIQRTPLRLLFDGFRGLEVSREKHFSGHRSDRRFAAVAARAL